MCSVIAVNRPFSIKSQVYRNFLKWPNERETLHCVIMPRLRAGDVDACLNKKFITLCMQIFVFTFCEKILSIFRSTAVDKTNKSKFTETCNFLWQAVLGQSFKHRGLCLNLMMIFLMRKIQSFSYHYFDHSIFIIYLKNLNRKGKEKCILCGCKST